MRGYRTKARAVVRGTTAFSLQILITAVVVIVALGMFQSVGGSAGGAPAGVNPCDGDVQLFSADANDDGSLDVSDVVWMLSYMFESGPAPLCLAQSPSPLDDLFVNEGQTDGVTSDMIVDGAIQQTDLAFDSLTPSGTLVAFAGAPAQIPTGWLLCDGSSLDPATFPALFAAIGTAHGGDGVTSFLVPDLRGHFLRGVDHGAGNDPDALTRTAAAAGGNTGDAVGSVQPDELRSHTHDFTTDEELANITDDPAAAPDRAAGGMNAQSDITDATGGAETRPKNVAVNWIIKT